MAFSPLKKKEKVRACKKFISYFVSQRINNGFVPMAIAAQKGTTKD